MKDIFPRVLVTGGGRRIGGALSSYLARAGFEVWVHVWQSQAAAAELIASFPEPELHRITRCNLSDPAARQSWLQTLPEFDLVINNASVYRLTAPQSAEKPSDRERYWQVNYFAPLEIIQKQYEQKSSRTGKKVAITLLDSDILEPDGGIKAFSEVPDGVDSYLPSRIKLAHTLKDLASEHAPQQRINAIAPGAVIPPVNCTTPGMTRILERVPMRYPVQLEEITRAVELFWNSPSLTGVILPVDGGMHLQKKASKL